MLPLQSIFNFISFIEQKNWKYFFVHWCLDNLQITAASHNDLMRYGERFTMATRPGGSNSTRHQNVKECQKERGTMTRGEGQRFAEALFPQRSRLSWPKQSQSPQPRKTNGGKSQPGGFDPLKGLWDLINMQLFCVKHRHKYMLWNVCHTRSCEQKASTHW